MGEFERSMFSAGPVATSAGERALFFVTTRAPDAFRLLEVLADACEEIAQ